VTAEPPGTTTPPTTHGATSSTTTTAASTTPPTTTTAPPITAPALASNPFGAGIASGDPDAGSVVLWTRLVGDDLPAEVDVTLELLDGGEVVATGVEVATSAHAHTVHAIVELDRPLAYRFRAGGFESTLGRTAPAADTTELRIASATCQHFETGFYAAHRDIAEWQPDLVLHLGDFIYEGASNPVGGVVVRSHEGPEPSDLDGRQFRSDQACGNPVLSAEPPCDETFDPTRTMLGSEQEAWLLDRFASSTARWNVVGQQTVMTDVTLDGAVLNFDQWDGYPAARDRLLAAAPADLVVITGDIHLAGVGTLGGKGTEFVTTAISSTANVDPALEELVRTLPNIVDAELVYRGYTRHTVTPERWTADYRIVEDITSAESPVSTWRSFVVDHGTGMPVTADA
jgi:phosphodiesterase/alkaline phosphatase D-like protein